ncbi:MAG: response regulator [Candidatus Binatia bacterium]
MAVSDRTPGPPTVLVVDDEEGPREALRMVLAQQFRVLTAASGEQALAIVARDPVDVVTLDLRMPGLDGVATLELMRQIAPDLGVVVITGYGSRETVMDTVYLGAFSYMNKPFHVTDVLDTVRRACGSSRR